MARYGHSCDGDCLAPRTDRVAGLFLFTGRYAMSFVINATFDVALEGPMQGIWFWCLVGFGI